MADEKQEPGVGELGGISEESSQQPAAPNSNQTTPDELPRRPGPPPADAVSFLSPLPIHRSGTLPTRGRPHVEAEDVVQETTRRRGHTISSRPAGLAAQPAIAEPRAISPRSQPFRRGPSVSSRATKTEGDDALGSIPESGIPRQIPHQSGSPAPRRPRGSTNSAEPPNFISPGMRPRMSTWGSPGGRMGSIRRRPTVNLGQPQALASGRDFDAQSAAGFSLAGAAAPMEAVVASNQPYVDPGYHELNPAYDQPSNTRPVWGLAKPLPRVLRPGMIPTKSELKIQIPAAEQQKQQDAINVDLEQGRMEPTLHLGRISSQLQNTRQERENRMVENFNRSHTFSPISPPGRQQTPSIAAGSVAIAEGEEDDFRLIHPPTLPPVAEHNPNTAPFDPGEPKPSYLPDDAASAITEKDQDGVLDGDWIGDEIPLRPYDPETDEIHNLHTHWSVIRLRFREPLAELLAVTCQLTLGFCADLVVTTSNSAAGNEATTDWAWGLASMVGIYIAGGISGAHLNPAVSIMLWIYRGFPLRKVPSYVIAQLLGAFIAGLISFGLYKNAIVSFGGSNLGDGGTKVAFITYPRYSYIDASTAFFTEFTGTAILAVAVLALGDDTNAPPGAGMSAFVLGLIITVLSMAFGYNTGAAMNPARDLGPRLALLAVGYGRKAVFDDGGYWFWGPWCATISGAIFGAFLYDAAIFVGGESPVNYPRRRIKRAGMKWRRKWGRRIKGVVGRGRYRGVRAEAGMEGAR